MESKHSILTKSFEQLQIQSSKTNFPSSSTTSYDHANVIEENARLKSELAKASSFQSKHLDDLLQMQKPHVGKEGLGYVAKKKNKKKAKPAQAKKSTIASGDATRSKTTRNDFAGIANPHYILYVDYYGDVYAKYVGPYDGYVARAIWVPKTLFAYQRGPIARWVPKIKQ